MQIRLALTFITALLFIALGLAWLTTFDEPEVPPTPSVQATERPQNFTPPVELTTQAIADTNSIDARLRNYFGSGNRTATRSVPPSHYYDAEKYNSLILLKAQLNNALDYGLGIENFLSYGLVPQQDGSLFLDIEKYPGFLISKFTE